jgi:hypothetical protein
MQIKATKVAAVVTGLAMATSMLSLAPMAHAASLTDSQVQSILSLLSSFGANSATIANVQAALNGTSSTSTSGSTTTTTASSCSVGTADLTIGSSGAAVTCLQQALIGGGYSISAGATGYFGAQTQAAVIAWQKAVGVMPAAGYFGAISRAHWNLGGGSSTTTTTTTTTGSGSVSAGTGNGLKITLSATSPNGTVLVQGQGIGDLGDYVFANPTATPINVTALSFMRTGVSNDATLVNVYLYNAGTRLTDSAGVSNSSFSFSNSAGLFTVPAGQTYTVSVRSDILGPTPGCTTNCNSSSGQQLGVELVSASSSGTLDSSVSFPIMSGYQTISAANLATVAFTYTSGYSALPAGSPTISPTTGYTVWQNTVNVSTNPVKLASMMFTNLGSINADDMTNIVLSVDGTQVGSTVTQLAADRTVTFDLTANPLMLNTGSHVIRVTANIVGGASDTFQLSLQRSSDAMFIDSQLNQPVTPVSNSAQTSFVSVSSSPVTIQSVGGTNGGVSVTRDPSSPTNDIATGASSVQLATYDMLASGEPTKVQDLYVCATVNGTGAGTGEGLQNGKIYMNGVQVGSTKNLVECSGSPSSAYTDFSLGSSLVLQAGVTAQVSVYADMRTSTTTVAGGNNVELVLVQGSENAQGQDSLSSANVPSADSLGNTLDVTSSTLSATKATGYGAQGVVAGTSAFKIGSFVLQAGSTENLNVNSIGIDVNNTVTTANIQNLKLVDESTNQQIGTTISSPSSAQTVSTSVTAGSNTFSTNLTLNASQTKTIDIYADIPSSLPSGAVITAYVDHSATNATGATTGTTATIGSNNVALQAITVGSGSLAVSLGASNPNSANAIAGASSLKVADYTFSANTSSYTVKKLELSIPTADAAAVSSVQLQYTDANNTAQTASAALTTVGATTTAQFSGLTFYVGANNSADVSVWISTPTITTGATTISGTPIAFTLVGVDSTTNSVQVQDASGNVTYSINGGTPILSGTSSSGYGLLVLRKSIPTFSAQSNSTTAAPNNSTVLYQFTVAADPAGAVDFNQFSFNVGTSTSNTLTASNFYLYDAANPSIALNTTAGNATTGGLVAITPASIVQIPAGSSKTFILKATISGWETGSSLSINLAPADTTLISNVAAGSVSGNYVWSDRSANSDSTTATQWTNGYLLRDLTDGTYSFTHS